MEEKIISREEKSKSGRKCVQGDGSSWASRPGRQGGEVGGYPGEGDLIMVVFWGVLVGVVKVKEMCCHVLNMYFRHILSAGLQIWIWFWFFPATNEKEGRLQLYLNLFCFFDVHTDFIFIVNKQRMED